MDDGIQKILKQNSKSSFFYSFLFLPKEKREAINIVYAFCKVSDDIVDSSDKSENKIKTLNKWREEFKKGIDGVSNHSLLNEIGKTILKFNIPILPFDQLLDGMEMDIHNKTYNTFDDLYQYCYNVASTVGIISIKIFGYQNLKSVEYAINLGIALQLTNIIRDFKQDLEMGRIYIPFEDLNRFNLSAESIFNIEYNNKAKDLLSFQYNRALSFYERADSNLTNEDYKSFLSARIMRNIYINILAKIERNNFNIFDKRITLSKLQKILIALKTYLFK